MDEALVMLDVYNKRLDAELISRKSLAKKFNDFISRQKDILTVSEDTLEVSWLAARAVLRMA